MTIDLEDLRRSRPENVRRLARALGVSLVGRRPHRLLCLDVYRRLRAGRGWR